MSGRVRRSREKSSGIEDSLENLPQILEEYDTCFPFSCFFLLSISVSLSLSPPFAFSSVSLFSVMHFSLLSLSLSLLLHSCPPSPLFASKGKELFFSSYTLSTVLSAFYTLLPNTG